VEKAKEAVRNGDFVWNSYRGPIKVRDMDDLHLVNVTHMVINRIKPMESRLASVAKENEKIDKILLEVLSLRKDYLQEVLETLLSEMSFRKIPDDTLRSAPYPFTDEQGAKRVWNYEKGNFDITYPGTRFIKDD